ncbi:hypothetical protein SDC9_87357 [bioreactor metagenome]|uniref:Uncharacterized protein n=1 Tax=bioreactor metagenome TaxID=1076179 RepID=A0A644ZIQ1_9ZZZZ
MRNKIFFSLFLMFISPCFLFSQQNTTSKKTTTSSSREELRQYRIQYDFAEKTFYKYKMTYKTIVKRTFADAKVENFERDMTVYLSFRRPSGLKDGFAELRTNLDSIIYKFTDGKKSYKWSSQADDDPIPPNPDFDIVFSIIGHSLDMTISPYFEVAKIEGEQLDDLRETIDKMEDTARRWIWWKANTDEYLKFYMDMNKNVLRSGRFAIDSTWKMKFSIPIEGVKYSCDTTNVKFYLYDGKNFNVKAEMPKMYPNLTDSSTIIGLANDVVVPVDSTSSSAGYWDVSVSPRGMLNTAQGIFTTKRNYPNSTLNFSDEIKTDIKYEFLGVIRWKD